VHRDRSACGELVDGGGLVGGEELGPDVVDNPLQGKSRTPDKLTWANELTAADIANESRTRARRALTLGFPARVSRSRKLTMDGDVCAMYAYMPYLAVLARAAHSGTTRERPGRRHESA
jgi:hypothetical protein